jgi:phenylpropionate dioxygenase-like ring-hydroxylating dioxygenase large terminal subunit
VIDPRLEFAATLPSRFYFDASVLAEENRHVFGRTWQLAGQAAQVREAGQFFTTTIGDEPVLVVRGSDGVLRAMSNVCRHRAGPIARGEGKRPVLQCGYHGWTYSLDGRLKVTPEFEGVQDFDRASCVLPQFQVEIWNELVFVNLDPRAEIVVRQPLRDLIEPMGQGGEEIAALHRDLVDAARRHVALCTRHRDLVSELANRVERRVRWLERPRDAVQVEQRLGEQRHLGGESEPAAERQVDHVEQQSSRLHLGGGELDVSRNE